MTIWILALVLLASCAGMGYRQGAIRVAFSLVGIPIAALLSPALGKFIKPVLSVLGFSHPVLLWILAPLVVFVIILAIFKFAAYGVHRKVEVFYKHKTSDLRRALWERLNARTGACLGLVNGLMYLVIVSWVIFALGYWTVQVASAEGDSITMRLLNRMSRDLQSTGMNRVGAAVDRTQEIYYDMADLTGLLFQNPLLEARLSRYPGFLSLGERPEYQAIAKDQAFIEMRQRKAPLREILKNGNIDQIVHNRENLKLLWDTAAADVKDLRQFLESGVTAKYTDPLLGRWRFSASASIAAYRREKPNVPSSEVMKIRLWMAEHFAPTTLMASPDHKIVVKQFPQLRPQAGQSMEPQNLQGDWKGGDGDYIFNLENYGERTGHIEAGRLAWKGETLPVVFSKEE